MSVFKTLENTSCPGRDSNPHAPFGAEGFKPSASTNSAIRAGLVHRDYAQLPSDTGRRANLNQAVLSGSLSSTANGDDGGHSSVLRC